jgi:FkbM family methyltransferase
MLDLLRRGVRKLDEDGIFETMFATTSYLKNKVPGRISEKLFALAEYSGNQILLDLIFMIYKLKYLFRGKLLQKVECGWVLKNIVGNDELAFPQFSDRGRINEQYRKNRWAYYQCPEFVQIEPGDIVFDVGAYIGVTSIMAAEVAKKVYAIEPSPRSRECLKHNVSNYDNIEVLPYAAWNTSEKIELEYGVDASEDGLIEPDDGGSGQSVIVQAHSIPTIANLEGIEKLDFLKIEAEGVETEIVDGIADSNINIRKISCAGNAERQGETTYQEVNKKLKKYGYETKVCPEHAYNMVYGRKNC